MINAEFWRSKRVFLTGHTGFKGAWLSLWLRHLGATVCGYALPPPTNPSLFDLADIKSTLESIEGDIRDVAKLKTSIKNFKPEIVIHMAAQSLVRKSYKDPAETFATNVMGSVNLLETLRETPSVRAALNVTSDKCYENIETTKGYTETSPMGGHDPYSASKGCAELVTSAFRHSFFSFHGSLSLASARAGNVIGGGDWAPDRLIPDFARAARSNAVVLIRNPRSTRPWQHVLDPLHGYLMLLEKLYAEGKTYAEGWNFGPDVQESQSVSHIANRLCELWNREVSWQIDGDSHHHEAKVLNLDCSKSHEKLGWKPKLDLEEALKRTVEWYQEAKGSKNLRRQSELQITSFESL